MYTEVLFKHGIWAFFFKKPIGIVNNQLKLELLQHFSQYLVKIKYNRSSFTKFSI